MKIALVPMNTGSGHNMRVYSLAKALKQIDGNTEMIVYLRSMQHVFTPLFNEIGVQVVDLTVAYPDIAKREGLLSQKLDWTTYVEGYIQPTFYNTQRIMRLLNLFLQYRPDVVVADFELCAVTAASIANIPCVLITERYNFVINGTRNEQFREAGFEINEQDMDNSRVMLDQLFRWLTASCAYVITDTPYVAAIDANTTAELLFKQQKLRFVGPMIRSFNQTVQKEEVRAEYGFDKDDFLIVATVSETTMLNENAEYYHQLYLNAFRKVRERIPKAKLLLISKHPIEPEEGMKSVNYIPHWIPLLHSTDVLLSHPGWITVTEVSSIGVPAIFVLVSTSEYHEMEAHTRLHHLGYETFVKPDVDSLVQRILRLQKKEAIDELRTVYKAVAPQPNGVMQAAQLILDAERQGKEQLPSR